jgi:hypothetical protein
MPPALVRRFMRFEVGKTFLLWLLVTVAVVTTAGYLVFAYQVQIETKIWHWRHGYSAQVGKYQVPVPKDWFPDDHSDHRSLDLIDTRLDKDAGALAEVSVISVDTSSPPVHELAFWTSTEQARLSREEIDQRALEIDGELVSCAGGEELGKLLGTDAVRVVSMQCQSTAPLALRYSGSDANLPEFYEIAPGIHKVSAR